MLVARNSTLILREGLIKKIEKKVGIFQLLVFYPPSPLKVGKNPMEPPHSPQPPLRNGKNFFAFLDVLDHLEAKKNEKEKSWKMTLLRPPLPLQVGNFQLFFRFF